MTFACFSESCVEHTSAANPAFTFGVVRLRKGSCNKEHHYL